MKNSSQKFILTLSSVVYFLLFSIPAVAQSTITFQYFYDERGQLVKVADSTGNVIEYAYDAAGNMLEIKRSSVVGVAIFSFTPQQGAVGAIVTIQGQGFSPLPTENIVQFNGNAATVTAATNSTLVVTVPPGATTGPITVTVGGQSATTDRPFTVAQAPVISAIQPKLAFSGQLIGNFQVTGQNLLGASFAFTSTTSLPAFTLSSLVINLDGTAATFVVQPGANTVGDFVLVATTPTGRSSVTPSSANTLQVFSATADTDGDNLANAAELIQSTDWLNPDTDGDSYADGLEVGAQSNPLDPASTPYTVVGGEIVSPISVLVNLTSPADPTLPNEAVSPISVLVNLVNPADPTLPNEAVSATFAVVNAATPADPNLPNESTSPVYTIHNEATP